MVFLDRLTPSNVRCIGKYALIGSLFIMMTAIILPYFILRSITAQLQREFQLTNENMQLWAATPGTKQVIYNKKIRFYSLEQKGAEARFDRFDLNTSHGLVFQQEKNIREIDLNSQYAAGVLEVKYTLDNQTDKGWEDKTIKQVRPAVLRALRLIHQVTLPQVVSMAIYMSLMECSRGIELNYVSAKIFYSKEYSQSRVYQFFDSMGITELSKKEEIWFDPKYGWREQAGFQQWVRVALVIKQVDSGLGKFICSKFNFTLSTVCTKIFLGDDSWLKTQVELERRRLIIIRNAV